jgi:hypothetical protein
VGGEVKVKEKAESLEKFTSQQHQRSNPENEKSLLPFQSAEPKPFTKYRKISDSTWVSIRGMVNTIINAELSEE